MNVIETKLKLLKAEGCGSLVADILMYLHLEVMEQEKVSYGEVAQLSQEITRALRKQYREQLKQKK